MGWTEDVITFANYAFILQQKNVLFNSAFVYSMSYYCNISKQISRRKQASKECSKALKCK